MITTDLIMKEIYDIESLRDFSDGVDISYSEMKSWIRKGLKDCKEKMIQYNLSETFSAQSTGNGKVFIEMYRQNNNNFTVTITVTNNYKTKTYIDVY